MNLRSLSIVAALSALAVSALAAPPVQIHVRGTVAGVSGSTLTVNTTAGLQRIQLAPKFSVTRIVAADRSRIKSNSFVGITSVAEPNGTQRAVEVHVFPDSMRGAGEGSRAWDYPTGGGGHSKMTNGTVRMGSAPHSRMTNGTVHTSGGNVVSVSYKAAGGSGAQTISIPPGIPVVTFAPGKPSDLKPGAHVFVMAAHGAGGLVSGRVMVGTPGVAPPM